MRDSGSQRGRARLFQAQESGDGFRRDAAAHSPTYKHTEINFDRFPLGFACIVSGLRWLSQARSIQ